MKENEAKRQLSEIIYIGPLIQSYQEELKRIERDKTNATDCKESTAIIKEEIEKLQSFKMNISLKVNALEKNEEKLVLRERYFLGKSWNEVGEKMFCSQRKVFRIHGEALESFRKKYNVE